ncbi:MAG: 23S rRNA methyltransferase [Coxiella sp. RIFCSPHIGHO2_12_FULL_42_15]|nr:MAG: 23S rRNA methyltransferase [Coxiella sp. RIFCSPHIGHO2_12_FULL_42_15]
MSDNKRWLNEHFRDIYVKKAKQEGYPSRAAYKLLEMHNKDHLLKPGMVVIDLGAAPGGWSKIAREIVGERGLVVAVDVLPVIAAPGVEVIQGDFNEATVQAEVFQRIQTRTKKDTVDLVISDMAPNITGQKSIDQPRSLHLVELAWQCAQEILRPGGTFVVKIFQGEGVDLLLKEWRWRFQSVKIRKPQSSRARSSEMYVVAQGLR